MTTKTFYARGDSSSANNASLNATGTNKVPTTELVFSSGATGDILLDYAGGGFDPDTTVFVDGVERFFTVEFSGTLPHTNKLSNVNGEDLRGEEIAVITTDDGTRYFILTNGVTSFATMDDFPNGAHPIENVDNTNNVIICFARDTHIKTERGEVLVQDLKVGDLLATADDGFQPIRWITSRKFGFSDLLCHSEYRPIRIPQGFLGKGLPSADLTVSPLHRIAISSWASEMLFFTQEAMLAAKHLMENQSIEHPDIAAGVEYFHILLDSHQVVFANDLPTESLYPGDTAIASLTPSARESFESAFTEYSDDWKDYGPTARRVLTRYEANVLISHAGLDGIGAIDCCSAPLPIAA